MGGLDRWELILGIVGGLMGLETALRTGHSEAKARRRKVRLARNLLARVREELKEATSDDPRSIFYASSK